MMTINRSKLFETLFIELNQSLVVATQASKDAHDLATHEQSKPETQYDTVGLEAAYLAHGQSQRVADITIAIKDWQKLKRKTFTEDSDIQLGAAVQVEEVSNSAKSAPSTKWFLLGNYFGGLQLTLGEENIMVITKNAPIGTAMLNKSVGDEFNLPNNPTKWFEVLDIC